MVGSCGFPMTDAPEALATTALSPGGGDCGDNLACRIGDRYGDHYVIDGLVAQGGMAEVYRARHEVTQRDVAFKVLSRRRRHQKDIVRRLEMEARAMAEIDHPNIVKILSAGRDKRVGLYIAMELLNGQNLREVLRACGQLPIDQAIGLAINIALASHDLHLLGIFHRDIKPENVLLHELPGGKKQLKLLDLGAAKVPKYGAKTTEQMRVIGTACYMSPEHVQSGEITGASDQYSLGVMLFEMLSGRLPFGANYPGVAPAEMYRMWQLFAEPSRLEEVMPDCPQAICDIVARTLRKDPAERFPSMIELVSALREVLRSHLEGLRGHLADRAAPAPTPAAQRPVEQARSLGGTDIIPAIEIDDAALDHPEDLTEPTPRPAPLLESPETLATPDEPVRALTVSSSVPVLTVMNGVGRGRVLFVRRDPITIGRDVDNDFDLLDETVSRHHAVLEKLPDGRWRVRDLDTVNAIDIDGVQVREQILDDGMVFRLGRAKLRFTSALRDAWRELTPRIVILDGPEQGKVYPLSVDGNWIGSHPSADICTSYDPRTSAWAGWLAMRVPGLQWLLFNSRGRSEQKPTEDQLRPPLVVSDGSELTVGDTRMRLDYWALKNLEPGPDAIPPTEPLPDQRVSTQPRPVDSQPRAATVSAPPAPTNRTIWIRALIVFFVAAAVALGVALR